MLGIWDGPVADHTWFDFERRQVSAISSAGTPYLRSLWWGIPKLPREVISSVFYLYGSRQEAEAGTPTGGTGFFVAVPSGVAGVTFPYAITNWHVAVRGGASVIRVNTLDGGTDIFEFDPSEWHFIPGGHDIAAIRVPHLDVTKHDITVLDTSMFVTKEFVERAGVGPGEDIFMIGRFIDYDGASTNFPAARFGNISIDPVPIPQPTGAKTVRSYILDVHSRTGFSGSPVFVYRTAGTDLSTGGLRAPVERQFLQLLGIHWGQFPEMWEIEDRDKLDVDEAIVSGNSKFVKGLSGMTMASPAWAIQGLLDAPKLKIPRDQAIVRVRAKHARPGSSPPVAEMATPTASDADANPDHREDFMRLVGAATKRPSPQRPEAGL